MPNTAATQMTRRKAMTEPTPTFAGEVQLRRWSESNTQGVQVTFALADSSDLEKFRGLDGKRFMAVLVQIGDDEQPVDVRNSDIKVRKSDIAREPLGDLCWRAVQWCKEPEFWAFLVQSQPNMSDVECEADAASRLKFLCNVHSRKELDESADARSRFNRLIRGPYQKHLIARGIVR